MSQFMDITLKTVTPGLEKLAKKLANKTPVHRMVAGTMADKVEENFEKEGRPDWMDLAESTKAQREKRGTWPGKKLQEHGDLASSINPQWDADRATVGTGLEYAAIHQFGGQAGRNRAVTIPARPFLQLTEADAEEILEEVQQYFMDL